MTAAQHRCSRLWPASLLPGPSSMLYSAREPLDRKTMAPPQTPSNAAQIEFWNGPTGQRWTRLQKPIEDNLRPFTEGVLKRLAPQPGERIVDVGCGAGDTSMALAERVQATGS